MTEIHRLRWLCRRGMKELDVLLGTYCEQHYEHACEDSQRYFRELLEWPDPDLYALLTGKTSAPHPGLALLAENLRELKRNQSK